MSDHWTEDEETNLHKLWQAGTSVLDVALQLQRTERGVYSRLHKLGYNTDGEYFSPLDMKKLGRLGIPRMLSPCKKILMSAAIVPDKESFAALFLKDFKLYNPELFNHKQEKPMNTTVTTKTYIGSRLASDHSIEEVLDIIDRENTLIERLTKLSSTDSIQGLVDKHKNNLKALEGVLGEMS